jgi:hypothetical protein
MRVDGKFMVGNDIPEGQGSVCELLAECYDLNYELRLQAEELEEQQRQQEEQEQEKQQTGDGEKAEA